VPGGEAHLVHLADAGRRGVGVVVAGQSQHAPCVAGGRVKGGQCEGEGRGGEQEGGRGGERDHAPVRDARALPEAQPLPSPSPMIATGRTPRLEAHSPACRERRGRAAERSGDAIPEAPCARAVRGAGDMGGTEERTEDHQPARQQSRPVLAAEPERGGREPTRRDGDGRHEAAQEPGGGSLAGSTRTTRSPTALAIAAKAWTTTGNSANPTELLAAWIARLSGAWMARRRPR
jgi:hypothetical protein